MSVRQLTETVTGRLTLSAAPQTSTAITAHQDTLLGQLGLRAQCHSHIFVIDDTGAIAGVVATDGILERLNAANPTERNRWSRTPLSHLVKLTLPRVAGVAGTPMSRDIDCTAVFENGSLVSIVNQQDVFLSWRRVAEAVSDCTTDPLTGLMSRMAYQRRLREEWERAQRSGFSIGIIIVDLDHLKMINDRYGHDAGDQVLRAVAMSLEASLRSYDVLVRYGGDEFVALCVGCRPGEIRIPIDRILRTLRHERRDLPEGVHVSVSIGAAVRHAGFRQTDSAALFGAADDCLYLAKESRDSAFWLEFGLDGAPDPSSMARESPALNRLIGDALGEPSSCPQGVPG